ncbi:MAG: N-acetylglucosamine-6-phosphate deacetylase [Succinivibrio sp.]|jgi:N-acetylglucosamine-6-phosphate deacetylase|nr:N-acetylglucosamine-6-phosphate deacetylase [Succinivibrio sp.]
MSATIFRNALLHVTSAEFSQVNEFAVSDHRIIPMDPALLENGTTEEINLNGMHVAPGFIDLLVNGCNGVSFANEPTTQTLEAMRAYETQHGTTTFVPTLISSQREVTSRALEAINVFKANHPGVCPGVHLEGPFINPLHKGFHPENYIRRITDSDLTNIMKERGIIAYMTVAPEIVRPKYMIALMSAGIKLSVGHSAATYFEALSAFKAGVHSITHIFNGMRPITGRDPGIIGAAFESPDVFAGIIADGRHVHPAVVKLIHRIMGDRLYIVSDAQAVAGVPKEPGSFSVAGTEIFVDSKRGLIDSKGSLAGTGITMMDGVKFLVESCGFTLNEALYAATAAPAHVLGLQEVGEIAGGNVADLVIFDDEYKVHYVLQNGYVKNLGDLM